MKRLTSWLSWLSIPALILVWAVATRGVPEYLFPSPAAVFDEAQRWLADGKIWGQLGASLAREAAGFSAAMLMAVLVGALTGVSRPLRRFAAPLVSFFMSIPPIAWAPLALLMFGVGDLAIIAVIFISSAFPMIVTIQDGVDAIGQGDVRAARTLNASRLQLARYVYLPASLPSLTSALRVGFAQAWRALVAAEMIGASRGIGWMVATGGQIGNTAQVLLGIILIGLIAWAAEAIIFSRLERHYRAWRPVSGT
jgi:ABC-type nitrate/sulfonate/bicarbonate transport system permease component